MELIVKDTWLPMRLRLSVPMNDEEFIRFIAANGDLQIEREPNGEILVMSPTFTGGGGRELDVAGELRNWALVDGRGRVFGPSSGFTLLDGSVRSADASWIRFERWNSYSEDEQYRSFTSVCPEFLIEVRSASDRLNELREKMDFWIANGAESAWLVDPQRKVVEVYRPNEETEVFANPNSVHGTGCVVGFELVMARVWQ